MPCTKAKVSSTLKQYVHLVPLYDILTQNQIDTICHSASQIPWNQNVPGGFTHNVPQRQVYSYGDGTGYTDTESSVGHRWQSGYWTAAVNQNDLTLVTETEPLPVWLQTLGLKCRELLKSKYNVETDDFRFNLAVCNKYTAAAHEIKEHTDDNEWYVKDIKNVGPLFASLTLYPTSTPATGSLEQHARFQLCFDGKWETMMLPHATLLLMPSCIPHRVLKTSASKFHERINITLRSVPSAQIDPIYSLLGVSNHARYYRLPKLLVMTSDRTTTDHIQQIMSAFNKCLADHKQPQLEIRKLTIDKKDRQRKRNLLKNLLEKIVNMPKQLKANAVTELLEAVLVSKR